MSKLTINVRVSVTEKKILSQSKSKINFSFRYDILKFVLSGTNCLLAHSPDFHMSYVNYIWHSVKVWYMHKISKQSLLNTVGTIISV